MLKRTFFIIIEVEKIINNDIADIENVFDRP